MVRDLWISSSVYNPLPDHTALEKEFHLNFFPYFFFFKFSLWHCVTPHQLGGRVTPWQTSCWCWEPFTRPTLKHDDPLPDPTSVILTPYQTPLGWNSRSGWPLWAGLTFKALIKHLMKCTSNNYVSTSQGNYEIEVEEFNWRGSLPISMATLPDRPPEGRVWRQVLQWTLRKRQILQSCDGSCKDAQRIWWDWQRFLGVFYHLDPRK